MTAPDCQWCHGTGWIPCVGDDDYGYEVQCPEGCPTAWITLDDEVPF